MKRYIPGIIVVEGKADENIIKSLFDVEILKKMAEELYSYARGRL